MLEVKNLGKIYKPKRGVAVKALDDVSLKFPDRGMVFLLGKSGSGKSTLLNLLGGLDKYNSGDIIIKGVSSKDFKQSHFDSYRNTYIGFIFQEYNVLEEFSVGANIALALELQGKKATDEEINKILKEVDLEGYGNRKPNELSGGQKQRVAIARALVKNPEIIMADEPTGALDSNTGRQVFDTLKKLSKNKLVIIVSHDREFSENYADRIIELADGKVISDVEYVGNEELYQESEISEMQSNLKFDNNIIEIAEGYHLTEEDRLTINKYIDDLKNGKVAIKIQNKKVSGKKFVDTNQDRIVSHDGKDFKLIKSKLPMKNAVKIGASGLKYKKFRLIVTIFLSFIAFGLFGLSDTMGSYDHVKTCTNSLMDSGITYVSLIKGIKTGSGINQFYDTSGTSLSDEDITEIENNIGTDFTPVYYPTNGNLSVEETMNLTDKTSKKDRMMYSTIFVGIAEISKETVENYGYKIVDGELPDPDNKEVAISKYMYDSFTKFGYKYNGKSEKIEKTGDIIGKTLSINNVEYKVTAIIDTYVDIDRYSKIVEDDEHVTTTEELTRFALRSEFSNCVNYSLASVAMVGVGQLDAIIEEAPRIYELKDVWLSGYTEGDGCYDPMYVSNLNDVSGEEIHWIEGKKEELGEKELIISKNLLDVTFGDDFDLNDEAVLNRLTDISIELQLYDYRNNEDDYIQECKIVGVLEDTRRYSDTLVVNDDIFNRCNVDTEGKYEFTVGSMPKDREDIESMVAYCYREDADTRYELQNAVTYELSIISVLLGVLSDIFFYIGIGFAIFSSLMLANFIGTSISHKKQEIGILRAIGSRSNDVFRIFISESFIIAMVNFILSTIAVFAVTNVINDAFRNEVGILVTVLHCGVRQIVLLFIVSIAVAFVACFLPVRKIAAKKPIDAIRNR